MKTETKKLEILTKKIKFKQHELSLLGVWYKKQVNDYLLRIVKYHLNQGTDITGFIEKMEYYFSVAQCQEIALNNYFDTNMSTHQNPKGFEAQYTHYASKHNKNISRDKRVRYIWRLFYLALLDNPKLEGIEPFDEIDSTLEFIECPYCKVQTARETLETVGVHSDGTLNNQIQVDSEINWCEHLMGYSQDYEESPIMRYDLELFFNNILNSEFNTGFYMFDYVERDEYLTGYTFHYVDCDIDELVQHLFKSVLAENIKLLYKNQFQKRSQYIEIYEAKVDIVRYLKGLRMIYNECW